MLQQIQSQLLALRSEVQRLRRMEIEGYTRRESSGGVTFGLGERRGASALVVSPLFVVSTESFDTVLCSDVKGGIGTIHVAKPFLLRRTPFTAMGYRRDGKGFVYTSNIERTVTQYTPAPPQGQTNPTENQRIIPKYVMDDVIYVVNKGSLSLEELFQTATERAYPEWLDINVDGRYWAKV